MLTADEQKRLDQLEQEEAMAQQLLARKSSQSDDERRLAQLEQEEAMAQQLLAQQQSQEVAPDAALAGFGQAASFGYLPQLQSLASKAVDYLTPESEVDKQLKEQGFDIQPKEEGYVEKRDKFAQAIEKLKQANPKAYLGGQVAGAISSGAGLSAIGGASKAVTAGQKIKEAVRTGALTGFLRGTDIKEGQGPSFDIEERLKNAGTDALVGGIVTGGITGAGKVMGALKETPNTIKKYAELKSLKASGAMLKDFRRNFGNKKAYDLGRTVLDKNIVQAGDDIADIAKRATDVKEAIGKEIGDIYSSVDDTIANIDYSKLSKDQVNMLKKTVLDLDQFAKLYKKDMNKRLFGLSGKSATIERVSKELDNIAENGIVDLKKLREVRSSIDDQINFSKTTNELPAVQKEFMKLRNKIQDITQARIKAVDSINGTNNLNLVKEANKQYSNMSEISKIATDKMAREQSNAAFGLRERISGGIGATVGAMAGSGTPLGPVGGAFVGGAIGSMSTKLARKYGTPIVAKYANKAASILKENSSLLGDFADPLIKAAEKSPKDYVKAVSSLMSNPDFKKKVKVME